MSANHCPVSLSEDEVLELLREKVKYLGSQKAVAHAAGVSTAFVCDVMKGRRAPTGNLLRYLGLTTRVCYVKL